VCFQGLLYELGLSAHETEVIAVKLEVDTNPPPGAVVTTTSLHRHVRLNLQHHDRASFLAGNYTQFCNGFIQRDVTSLTYGGIYHNPNGQSQT